MRRRVVVARAALRAIAVGARAQSVRVASLTSSPVPAIAAVGPVELTVSDLDRSLDFYTRVLTFTKVSETEVAGEAIERLNGVFGARIRQARLRLGDEEIELSEYLAPRGRPRPVGARSNDRSFQHIAIIVADMDKAFAVLQQHKVEFVSTGPQTLPAWNPNAGGIQAFYFKDPDGHPLEILHFPPGKGAAKWRLPSDRLFLGIDHTAIVVGDTDASLAFYRDLLGFRIAGTSENYGVEQEHLNNVPGARLRITSLRAANGPAIEFIQYLAPRDGRPFPPDEHANDLVHWQTRLVAADLDGVARTLRKRAAPFISPGAVTLPDDRLGFARGLLVRDPDGHVMEVVQK
jgi:catechol 2,3-dioxygenase-like lactoylglutathione lyase family enzyme